jgi:hypothetical protein
MMQCRATNTFLPYLTLRHLKPPYSARGRDQKCTSGYGDCCDYAGSLLTLPYLHTYVHTLNTYTHTHTHTHTYIHTSPPTLICMNRRYSPTHTVVTGSVHDKYTWGSGDEKQEKDHPPLSLSLLGHPIHVMHPCIRTLPRLVHKIKIK